MKTKTLIWILPLVALMLILFFAQSCKKDNPEPTTVTDIDGNVYKTVKIGTQTWMAENLKVTRYRNGDAVGTSALHDISGETAPKYQWAYGNNEANVAVYGRLYTSYAAADSRGLCPTGWHVPSDEEWTILENYLISKGYNYDGSTTGNKIGKALASDWGWTFSLNAGSIGNTDFSVKRNATGFSALPGGYRTAEGVFACIGTDGFFWTSTFIYDGNATILRELANDYGELYSNWGWNDGLAIRCVKD